MGRRDAGYKDNRVATVQTLPPLVILSLAPQPGEETLKL